MGHRMPLICALLCTSLSSCTHQKESPTGTEWVKTSELNPQTQRQSQLNDDQRAKVKQLQSALAEVDPSSLDKWIKDFEKDRDPEREIRIWEAVVFGYQSYCFAHPLTIEGKKKVLGILVLRSETSDEAEILRQAQLKVLTTNEAHAVIALYKGDSGAIQVERR
jgi:hypothetical protein